MRRPSRLCSWFSSLHSVDHPLSSVISSLNLNHHLYADDTQLFFSFYPCNFDSYITHLHNALDRISAWMTANLLNLNSSKTEFLLIGNKQNSLKYITLHLIPPTLLTILALFSMNISLFLIKYLHCPNLAILIFVNFVVFVLILISKQLVPSAPPLFTINFDHCISVYTSIFQCIR